MKKFLLVLSLITLQFSMTSPVMAASTAFETLKNKVVKDGDGLYKDSVTEGRYVYKGENPDNFISFNNELWRIMSIEKDGSLKIIRANPLDTRIDFDGYNEEPVGDSYCDWAQFGCNAWAKTDNFSNGVYAGVKDQSRLDNGKYTQYNQTFELKGKVNNNSNVNSFLNNIYFKGLSDDAKSQIESYDYNIGGVSLEDNEYSEKVAAYFSAKSSYEGFKKSYEDNPSYEYGKSEMEKYKQEMEELKPAYESYFTLTDEILKGNVTEEAKYTWKGNVAMASLTDILEATTDTDKCGTLSLLNNNSEKIDENNYLLYQTDSKEVHNDPKAWVAADRSISVPFKYTNLRNNCWESNYLIPSDKYKFTDYNYLLITPVYNSNELVYAVSNSGLNPQYVYQEVETTYYNTYYIRPVVHLKSSVNIIDGIGSAANPYRVPGSNISSDKINNSQIVDVPPTALFTSLFVIGGAVVLLVISGYLYLKVFKKKVS